MNTIQRIPAVFAFEWRRALTIPRMALMIALSAFPPILLIVARMAAQSSPPMEAAAITIYILSPCVATMMSVFLLATPAISSELEGRSWVYLAVRPHGPLAVLLGKYLVAVSWAMPVGILSAVLGSLALRSNDLSRLISVQCSLVVLSCLSYAAAFILIGVIAPKRAMVIGVVYAILFEVVASFVPAAINLLTIQHRLRCILVRGMEFDSADARRNPVFLAYFGDESMAWHVGILLAMTIGYLVISAMVLKFREFTFASETDT